MDRRSFLKTLTLGAAGLLVPTRKVWALDRTMLPPSGRGQRATLPIYDALHLEDGDRITLEYLPPISQVWEFHWHIDDTNKVITTRATYNGNPYPFGIS